MQAFQQVWAPKDSKGRLESPLVALADVTPSVSASVYCTICKNSEANYFVNASRPRFRMKESGAYVICSFMGEAVFRCRFGLLKHLFWETHLPQQGNSIAGIGRALHKAVREMHALLRKLLPEMYLGIVFQ